MKTIITFTSNWNALAKEVIAWLESAQQTKTFTWHNFEFSDHRDLAETYNVKKPQTYILTENNKIFDSYEGALNIEIFNRWIDDTPTVAEIIEASEAIIQEDDVIVEVVELVEEELFVVDDEPNETVIEDLQADISLLTPPQIAEEFEVLDVDQVYDDEFSDEDLGNDTPESIDPDDLF